MNSGACLLSPANEFFVKSKSESEEADIVEESPDGRYIRYDEVLGCGAFKVVYKGFDQEYGIEVAWNQMCVDDDALQSSEHRERLLSEAVLMKSLKHENIIKCYNSWMDNENKTVNIITELFSSGNLRQYRRKHKGVDMKAIKNWARQILRGLHYLHSHNPPIIHRDLKCENIFVNGNHGEVKIGDLGLATAIMQQGSARSVMGTPEFMAPELYDEEEYDELVDIYSFGMCMLELITFEYPYSECENQAQIYKKVTSGIKPAALGKVKDPQARQFIEKCLVSASQRLAAVELLKDPFLSSENSKEPICEHRPLPPNSMPEPISVPKPDSQISMDIDPNYGKLSVSTCTRSMNEPPSLSTLEMQRYNENYQFRLRGERIDDNSISFILRITDFWGRADICQFVLHRDTDSAPSIAVELVGQRLLLVGEVPLVADLMDSLLLKLVPGWEPSFGNCSSEDSVVLRNRQRALRCAELQNHGAEESFVSDTSVKYNATTASDANFNKALKSADYGTDECIEGSKVNDYERCEGSVGESVITSEFTKNSEISFVDSCSAISNNLSLSISSLSLSDKDQCCGLKLELDTIDMQYHECCRQLLRMRDEAIENAKRGWITNRKMPVV